MSSISKSTGAIFAGMMLALSLGPTAIPMTAFAETTTQTASQRQGEDGVTFVRTDSKYDGKSASMISQIEERSYKLVVPVEGKSVSDLSALIDAGKVDFTLSRDKGIVDETLHPHQCLGGKLADWKTVSTENGPAESGNGTGEEGTVSESRPMFYDIKMEAKEVDGKASIVLTFKNRLLFEGVTGNDVRYRETVRSATLDYTGTFQLACMVDGKDAGSTDVDIRPYDSFTTQEQIDAQLPELAQQAIDNGLYAEVRQYGTTVEGRPMNALFVCKNKEDLDSYLKLKERMESEPAKVQEEVRAGKLEYKVPVVYSNVHADEIPASDSVMSFARDLVKNEPVEYKTVTGLTDAGKAELKTEMDHDKTVWSDLIADKVTGIGYIRGNGGKSNGINYDGPDTDNASADLSDKQFAEYYTMGSRTFDPSKLLDDEIFILIPSENVDARQDNVRTNGNGFDLNRDNTYQTQPETQAMSGLISEWDPLTLHEVHGFYQQYQVEPCSPTHDPNNEYDLFADTAFAQGEAFMGASIANNETINSAQMPMRDYLKLQDDGTCFWEMPFDDMSTSYTPQYAMMHGTNAYTVEAPYGTEDAVTALKYGFIGNADFVAENKDRMFLNQLERFRRGVENIDAAELRKYYVNQADEAGAEADLFRPQDNENKNFFPEYYVIPMDDSMQQDRAAADETVAYLLHNGVKVSQTTKEVKVGDVTYPEGTVVVDMHQAKRNMANCALYPNLVISDWTAGSLYSEPVANFSALRGFDMDTVRTAGAFDGSLKEIDEAPKESTVVEGEGPCTIIKNNGLDAVKAANKLLADGKAVGLITEGDYEGSYAVATADFDAVKGDFVLDAVQVQDTPTAKSIEKNVKVYVPKGYEEFQTDADGNEVGMKGYENRLNTEGNWDTFALEDQLGFTTTDNLDDANIIVGNQYPINADEVAAKVKAGTPYVAYTAGALQFLVDYKLVGDMDFTPNADDGGWLGYDALTTVNWPEDDIITATYKNEGDNLMYGYGGGYITKVPEGSKVLIKTTGDDFVEGFMPADAIDGYKDSIQAIDYQKDGENIAVFANTLTNKAHQQDDYRYLTAAIYSKQLGDEFVVASSSISSPALIGVAVLVAAGACYFVYRKKKGDAAEGTTEEK